MAGLPPRNNSPTSAAAAALAVHAAQAAQLAAHNLPHSEHSAHTAALLGSSATSAGSSVPAAFPLGFASFHTAQAPPGPPAAPVRAPASLPTPGPAASGAIGTAAPTTGTVQAHASVPAAAGDADHAQIASAAAFAAVAAAGSSNPLSPGGVASTMPGSASSAAPPPRCAGLEYANMKKEEAREQYKDRRRRELLDQGEIERVKRRKKNDSSMSEDQKYSRRLKMNQDSAAAARAAQDAYVSTLEKLVETAEAEKSMLSLEANNLRQERDDLARRLHALQFQVASALPALSAGAVPSLAPPPEHDPTAPSPEEHAAHVAQLVQSMNEEMNDGPSSPVLLKKMIELFEAGEAVDMPSVMTNDVDFARGILGIMPAPAV